MPRFSVLLESLSGADGAETHFAGNPEIEGAAALDQASKGQLSFLAVSYTHLTLPTNA